MSRISVGYGTGLAATLKTLKLVAQTRQALEKAKSDADIRRIRESIQRENRRIREAIKHEKVGPYPPGPAPRPNPALDNWITK
jgi:hypothetical protein